MEYSREDFLNSQKPFQYIKETAKDPLHEEQLIQQVEKQAREYGVKSFRKMYLLFKSAE